MQKGKHILREPITFPFGVLKNLVALCCLTVILTFDPPLGTNCSLVVPSRIELGATGVEFLLLCLTCLHLSLVALVMHALEP